MKELIKICEKEKTDLFRVKEVKWEIEEMQKLFKSFDRKITIKNDLEFFYAQLLKCTLVNKRKFETAFLKAFDEMADYWQSLNYQEKKRLMNVEIDKCKKELPYQIKNQQKQYLPLFDDRMNQIYSEEMVLFELKQYHNVIHDFDALLDKKINMCAIRDHLTSLQFIEGNENCYSAFCLLNHKFYLFKDNEIVFALTLSKCNIDQIMKLAEFSTLLKQDNMLAMIDFILQEQWCSDKILKKLGKIAAKLRK